MGRTVLTQMGRFTPAFVAMLQNAIPEVEFLPAGEGASSDALLVMLDDREAAAGIVEAITPEVRWIHVFNAGMDKFPLEAVGDRILTGSRGAAAPAIAEWVLAVMLAFAKQLPSSWVTEPPEHWGAAGLADLRKKTLGLIGLGEIGREVARRALAFDMNVLAVRRTGAASPLPGVEVVISLHDMLAVSDHVVVTAPATPATKHLLDAGAFAAMKPGAHLVNIARGSLVDQDALLAALDAGTVAAASLDVFEPEPLPAGHPLYVHPNVRVSPHISWSSPDTIQRMLDIFVENLRRHDAGQQLQGVIDVKEGY